MNNDFHSLVIENRSIVYQVINKYERNEQLHDDLFHDIYIRAYSTFNKFKGDCKFSTWLYRVSMYTMFDKIRKRAVKLVHCNIFFEIPDEEYFEHDLPPFDYLTTLEKETLNLYLSGMTNTEIAHHLGVDRNRINVRMNRIKITLRKYANYVKD